MICCDLCVHMLCVHLSCSILHRSTFVVSLSPCCMLDSRVHAPTILSFIHAASCIAATYSTIVPDSCDHAEMAHQPSSPLCMQHLCKGTAASYIKHMVFARGMLLHQLLHAHHHIHRQHMSLVHWKSRHSNAMSELTLRPWQCSITFDLLLLCRGGLCIS